MPKDQTAFVYAYSERSDFLDATARSSKFAVFGFQDGILRAVVYVTDFPADQPSLPPGVVEHLVADPGATHAQFLAALGPPQAVFTASGSALPEADAWYVAEKGPRAGLRIPKAKIARLLVVGFDKNGVMVSHRFELNEQ